MTYYLIINKIPSSLTIPVISLINFWSDISIVLCTKYDVKLGGVINFVSLEYDFSPDFYH